MVTSDAPKVKGLAFRSVANALRSLCGEPAFEAALDQVPEELARLLRYGGLVATGWYPIDWYRAWLAAARAAGGGQAELLRQIGARAVEHDLSSIHKMILGMLSPETVFRVTPRFFSQYYTHGRVEVLERRRGFQRIRWSDCREFDENMWLELVGGSYAIAEAAGAEHVRIRVTNGGGDADHMTIEARYT